MIFICIIDKTEGGIKNGQFKDNVKMGTRHRTKANKQAKTKITTKNNNNKKHNTIQKSKQMSNTDLTTKQEVNPGVGDGSVVPCVSEPRCWRWISSSSCK